ncbi:hypothetical protein CEE37_10345 [candidate division LCP-89 bacterium B3_LCP]|uniref:Right handed beta helix domain-containing protein n=1 Tax=candidate division LCP-89 bacterium B3_LCP TaxID=2012998 RepID=A0A532UYW6_UNCL8|nr:MAG: hypothetical protein CEE37_10345 [candidate division LCP-89 bacterium B3_LCP]
MKRLSTAVCVIMLLAMAAYGATILVPDQYPTIQAGINAASAGDTVLVSDGDWTGPGNRGLDFGGRAIVVMSANGPENCVIDCQSGDRGFYFRSGETASSVLYGFTIVNGYMTQGGGIHIANSSPTIERCIVFDNGASYGGGFYIANSSPVIEHCTIIENSATNGGAVYSTNSNPDINSCVVADNTASG